jgi:hypothetical protein
MLDWCEASACLQNLLQQSRLFKGFQRQGTYTMLWLVRTILVPVPRCAARVLRAFVCPLLLPSQCQLVAASNCFVHPLLLEVRNAAGGH